LERKERREKKAASAKAKEEESRVVTAEQTHDEYERMCEDERAYQEDIERERELQAEWAREDKEREERRATMTEEENRQEEEEWEDDLETGYDNAQIALDYWRKTGIWSC